MKDNMEKPKWIDLSPISKELQIGKAGEHLVCADLILQGFNAFLADQGLPYDVLVDVNNQILRIQTKTTHRLKNCGKSKTVYRYGTRRARGNRTRIDEGQIDFFAFVAIDFMIIGYLPISAMRTMKGKIKQTIEFRSRKVSYPGRDYPNGSKRIGTWGNLFLEDFSKFKP